jgi:predicted lipoprotein with Yx(FWY)xxD motif
VIATVGVGAGTYLVDSAGRALYLFDADSAGKSACSGPCASAWPPVTTTVAATAAGGAKASDLGTITRSDGSLQVTYGGHPLYLFAGDMSAGQTNGQGINGFGAKWWLVTPAGAALTGAAPASVPTAAPTTKAGGWA